MTQLTAGLVEHIAERHGDQFQMGTQAFVFGRRQYGKEVVLLWGVGLLYH